MIRSCQRHSVVATRLHPSAAAIFPSVNSLAAVSAPFPSVNCGPLSASIPKWFEFVVVTCCFPLLAG